MRIVLDARKYFDYGIGTYIQNLVPYLAAREELVILVAPDDVLKIELPGKIRTHPNSSKKYSLSELRSIARDANSLQADLFHSPHYTIPFGLKMPCVTTIHDVLHVRGTEYFSLPQRLYARMSLAHAFKASDAIIVDSEFSKREILELFPVDHKNIHVVHLGISPMYFQSFSENDLQKFRVKYSLHKPAILYTGSLKGHKNVKVLIEAFARLTERSEFQLIFAGESISQNRILWDLIQRKGLVNNVVELGHLSQKELALAYRAATVAVLPSFYEGFGFSVLEAMASGIPVIGARAGSIPEVMGEGGILFDPRSADELQDALEQVIHNVDLRSHLVKNGFANVKRFSWERCAEQTYQIYKDVM